ncbi:MAG: hypothetical protein RIT45_1058 [Pseudomonadota bacterium]
MRRSAATQHAIDVVVAMLFAGIVHRLGLYAVVLRAVEEGGVLEGSAWGAAFARDWLDLAAALMVGVVAGLGVASWTLLRRRIRWLPAPRRRWRWLASAPLLLAIGALRRGHLEMIAAMKTGLGADELRDLLSSGEAATATASAAPGQLALAAAPALALAVVMMIPQRPRGIRAGLAMGCIAVGLAPALLGSGAVDTLPEESTAPPELWSTAQVAEAAWQGRWRAEEPLPELPPAPTAEAVVAQVGGEGVPAATGPGTAGEAPATEVEAAGTGDVPLPAEVSAAMAAVGGLRVPALARVGARIADPRVADPSSVPSARPEGPHERWNVVWLILESVGTRYVEGETFPGRRPMPTLDRLAAEGWKLAAHRSPSNSSATSISAQLTGLYPLPHSKMMSVQKDNHLPALPAFLPGYDRFLVTPGKLSYFFPRALLEHSGMRDLVGLEELPFRDMRALDKLSKDEIKTVDFFLDRLRRAQEPFFGVYYSFVPHWEYTDYGREWRRYRGSRLIDRYHNNLWLLDHQIGRIVEQLRADGLLERTILVLAGDHGEAFGQHERNWAHSRGSYEENLQTPAVLWQPALFPPRVESRPTCHIDLLPTLLDAMGLRYEPRLLQGESLFQRRPRRAVTFHWGNEGTVTALRHADRTKLLLSTKDRSCRVFRLARDPKERHPAGCGGEAELLATTRAFVRTQRALLPALSEASRAGVAFEGWRHPGATP